MDPTVVARRLRKLLRARRLTPHEYALADTLLWSCRRPNTDRCTVSFSSLARLAGVGRTTAVAAVRKLQQLGVLTRVKRWVIVVWGLGRALRQAPNGYIFSEVAPRPVDRGLEILPSLTKEQGPTKRSFAGVADSLEAALQGLGRALERSRDGQLCVGRST